MGVREHSKQRQHSHKERRKCASYRASKRPIATVGRGSSASVNPFRVFVNRKNCYGVDRFSLGRFGSACVDCYTGNVALLNRIAAVIPVEKLRNYLLSPTHPIGRYKRRSFERLAMIQAIGKSWKLTYGHCYC